MHLWFLVNKIVVYIFSNIFKIMQIHNISVFLISLSELSWIARIYLVLKSIPINLVLVFATVTIIKMIGCLVCIVVDINILACLCSIF